MKWQKVKSLGRYCKKDSLYLAQIKVDEHTTGWQVNYWPSKHKWKDLLPKGTTHICEITEPRG